MSVRVYENAFSSESGRCFRIIYEESTTRPTHCPGSVVTRGWWQDGIGRWWAVDACPEHSSELSDRRPGPGARFGVAGASSAAPTARKRSGGTSSQLSAA